MTENTIRALSGLLYIGLILGSIYAGEIYFTGLILLFTLLVLWEYCRLIRSSPYLPIFSYTAIVLGFYCYPQLKPFKDGMILSALGSALILTGFLLRVQTLPKNILKLFTWTYIMGGSLGIISLYDAHQSPTFLVVLTFGTIWANNTFAYLFGKSLGKNPLAPKVSPKKSWEGFFGGTIMAVLFSMIYSWISHEMPFEQGVFFGVGVAIFATLGDLVQSQIKRQVQVKDSGSLLPGHGGFFDRMDSIIFTAPFITGIHIIYFYVS